MTSTEFRKLLEVPRPDQEFNIEYGASVRKMFFKEWKRDLFKVARIRDHLDSLDKFFLTSPYRPKIVTRDVEKKRNGEME